MFVLAALARAFLPAAWCAEPEPPPPGDQLDQAFADVSACIALAGEGFDPHRIDPRRQAAMEAVIAAADEQVLDRNREWDTAMKKRVDRSSNVKMPGMSRG